MRCGGRFTPDRRMPSDELYADQRANPRDLIEWALGTDHDRAISHLW